MPDLIDIASHFDDIDVTDAYSGVFAFKGQVSSVNETSPDGSINKKRTLSVRPATVIPSRRVISYFSEKWVVGEGNTDGLQNTQLRTAFWMRKVTDTVLRLSPAELCNAAAGYSMFVAKEYLKDTVNSTTDSEYDPQWDISISRTETVAKGQFLKVGTTIYRVRSVHATSGGFLVANSDELDGNPLVSVSLSHTGAYNPVTDTYAGSTTTTQGILFEPTKLFRFRSQADARFLAGDMTLILPVSVPVGGLVTLAGIPWKVLAVTPELDGWNLHIRRA